MRQVTERDYKEAISNPPLRSEFVRAIDLEDVAEYITSVDYSSFQEGRLIMATRTPIVNLPFVKLLLKPRIEVYPFAFNPFGPHYCLADFLSDLIDHEGEHAKIHSKRRFLRKDPDLDYTLRGELEVERLQLPKAVKRGCSPQFIDGLRKSIAKYERALGLDSEAA